MSRTHTVLRLSPMAALLGLGACVTAPPAGPSFVALPGDGKTYDRFVTEDNYCRQSALGRSGSPGAAQANSGVTGAVAGTAIGAGAGALLGAAAGAPGIGAAAGAGTGLLAGSAVGSSNGAFAAGGVQQSYDASYAQCMTSYGNKVPPPAQIVTAYPAYAYGPGWGWGWGWGGLGWGGLYASSFYGPGFYGPGFYRVGFGPRFYGHGFYGRGFYGRGGFGHGGFHGGHHR